MADDAAPNRKRRRTDEPDGTNAAGQPDTIPPTLPSAMMYEKSYMHRDIVVSTFASDSAGFFITCSADGHVKFWKKLQGGVEFVKNFKAFVGPIVAAALSADGQNFVAAGADSSAGSKGILRFWDVNSFDLVDFRKLPFVPGCCCWVYSRGAAKQTLAVSDRHSGAIHLLDPSAVGQPPMAVVKLHTQPVAAMAHSPAHGGLVVSADGRGMLEVWSPDPSTGYSPSQGVLSYSMKLDTDMFAVARAKALPIAVAVGQDGKHFAVQSTDGHTRIFVLSSGKLLHDLDDSPGTLASQAASGQLAVPLDDDDLQHRVEVEKELMEQAGSTWKAITAPPQAEGAGSSSSSDASSSQAGTVLGAVPYRAPAGGLVFDDTSEYVLYTCVLGIKVVHVASGALVGVLGAVEATERFTFLALYQGVPKVSSQQMLAKDASALSAPMAGAAAMFGKSDPTVVCTAYRRSRFYLFTAREPEEDVSKGTMRDVLNEPPSAVELAALAATAKGVKAEAVSDTAIIHTTCGDVHVRLYPKDAPKAVENFCRLAASGYYDKLLWHRVIRGFMVQGGDPRGDGTGGESCWGKPFDDEVVPHLTFAKPGQLAMANAGPCTNGSQFFITTGKCDWLNGKHTIFGSVTRGMENVRLLEAVKTGKDDRPLDDIRILGVTIKA